MVPSCAAPVFGVTSLESALIYYTQVLGFAEDFRFGDYAGVKLGAACIHLSGQDIYSLPVVCGTAYIFCDEVDAYCAGLQAKGATLLSTPCDQPYGMRDFMAADPDGNRLSFGCDLPSAVA